MKGKYSEAELRRIKRFTNPIGIAVCAVCVVLLLWLGVPVIASVFLAACLGGAVRYQVRSSRQDAISRERREQRGIGR